MNFWWFREELHKEKKQEGRRYLDDYGISFRMYIVSLYVKACNVVCDVFVVL